LLSPSNWIHLNFEIAAQPGGVAQGRGADQTTGITVICDAVKKGIDFFDTAQAFGRV
jgi:aryl-alcohol dehydrogenase-like predicted oxidoreductase